MDKAKLFWIYIAHLFWSWSVDLQNDFIGKFDKQELLLVQCL